ncbi:hypothetical protein [Parapedobacter indicus]|uniref:Outer membrane protein beta-barrel domain-containing protein n=1 Tax=Parapedobacter indicus TaxID=1477437 RepID=A0A1I3F3G8_9SPHI|nr:hypothetical protein [Parapedobacter indicus]PPL03528.1 hypothetical protein CLV26_102133 [Parapedobacter indicus]SFI05321.1 hypothetical protein SAMN05444682_102133 [Parapedobacter indicus]
MMAPVLRKSGWMGVLLLAALELHAQRSLPVYLEGEFGVERFGDASVRSVFPTGAALRLGAAFALADQGRLRLRPQGGVTFYGNKINEEVTEQLLFVKGGMQVSYDAFFLGRMTFFPYLGIDYNWVSNFDMESYDGEEATYSENYLHGTGISQEIGLRVQISEWYVKAGYGLFRSQLRVRRSILDNDLTSGYVTPPSHSFQFDTINISVGFSIRP